MRKTLKTAPKPSGATRTVWVPGDPPLAPVTARERRDGGGWSLVVRNCPFCGRKHFHGGGGDPLEINAGHRVSHCLAGVGGYVLVVTTIIRQQGTPRGREQREAAGG